MPTTPEGLILAKSAGQWTEDELRERAGAFVTRAADMPPLSDFVTVREEGEARVMPKHTRNKLENWLDKRLRNDI